MAGKKDNAEREKEGEIKGLKLSIRKREIYWIIGVIVCLIAVLILTNYIVKGSNSFTYQTLKFTKSVYGQIPVYVYTYNFKDSRIQPPKEYSFNLLLRNDPRENKVPVKGEIIFPGQGGNVYVAINGTGFIECKNSARDLATLSGFLTVNLFSVKAGLADRDEANKSNLTYISCNKYPSDIVLNIQTGNDTKIDKKNRCYTISVNNCELLNAVEKFEIQSIIDAKKRASNHSSS